MSHSTRTCRRALGAGLLLLLAACAAPPPTAWRQPGDADRAAVLETVARSFQAIAAKGAEAERLWREVLLDDGAMSSVRERDGEHLVRVQSFAEHFAELAEGEDPRACLERFWDPVVLVDGDIATVWARYDFWLDGSFSHGGTDVIVLLRSDVGWRVASFAWSVEPEAGDSPLAPPRFDDIHE